VIRGVGRNCGSANRHEVPWDSRDIDFCGHVGPAISLCLVHRRFGERPHFGVEAQNVCRGSGTVAGQLKLDVPWLAVDVPLVAAVFAAIGNLKDAPRGIDLKRKTIRHGTVRALRPSSTLGHSDIWSHVQIPGDLEREAVSDCTALARS